MTHLDLFAGAGGASWFGKLIGATTVGYVENDKYCQQVLRARIKDGIFDDAPIFDDVRTFDGLPYRGRVDLITAGFPCQPFSCAGKRQGEADERNMWPDTIRILREVRPRYAILENVPGLLATDYIRRIFGDLAANGFDAEWEIVSAADVGAPHRRQRLWIMAHAAGLQLRGISRARVNDARYSGPRSLQGQSEILADAGCKSERQSDNEAYPIIDRRHSRQDACRRSWWQFEPGMGRVANGVPNRSNRLRCLGNGWVPAVAYEFWQRVMSRNEC